MEVELLTDYHKASSSLILPVASISSFFLPCLCSRSFLIMSSSTIALVVVTLTLLPQFGKIQTGFVISLLVSGIIKDIRYHILDRKEKAAANEIIMELQNDIKTIHNHLFIEVV